MCFLQGRKLEKKSVRDQDCGKIAAGTLFLRVLLKYDRIHLIMGNYMINKVGSFLLIPIKDKNRC